MQLGEETRDVEEMVFHPAPPPDARSLLVPTDASTVTLESSVVVLPHPKKVKTGGEDASFSRDGCYGVVGHEIDCFFADESSKEKCEADVAAAGKGMVSTDSGNCAKRLASAACYGPNHKLDCAFNTGITETECQGTWMIEYNAKSHPDYAGNTCGDQMEAVEPVMGCYGGPACVAAGRAHGCYDCTSPPSADCKVVNIAPENEGMCVGGGADEGDHGDQHHTGATGSSNPFHDSKISPDYQWWLGTVSKMTLKFLRHQLRKLPGVE